MITWGTIKALCDEAGIHDEFEEFEAGLKNRFTTALLQATDTQDKYLEDGIFRSRVNKIIAIVVVTLTQQSEPRAASPPDIEDLKKIFDEEVKDARG